MYKLLNRFRSICIVTVWLMPIQNEKSIQRMKNTCTFVYVYIYTHTFVCVVYLQYLHTCMCVRVCGVFDVCGVYNLYLYMHEVNIKTTPHTSK